MSKSKRVIDNEDITLRMRKDGKTLQEIGELLGLSKERIRQMEYHAKKRAGEEVKNYGLSKTS